MNKCDGYQIFLLGKLKKIGSPDWSMLITLIFKFRSNFFYYNNYLDKGLFFKLLLNES